MLRTLSLAGLWAVETNIRTRRRALLREYKELRNHRHLWICHNAFVVNPARKTHSIYNNYSLKHEKKNGAPCFRKLIFLSQKFRHLKTITYKSMQNCWYSTFDIKEALNERKKCYQNLFSNERIFKQKKTYGLPMNQQVPTVRGPDRLQIHGAAKWMNQWTAPVINWSRQSYSM